jgi:peptidoglycan/LPS O-acetylase OafA/YrhL
MPIENERGTDDHANTPDPAPALLSNTRALAYSPRLDGLRCVAIAMVLIEHFGGPVGGLYAGGYYGVDLFFVISGYLITGILLKSSHRSFAAGYRTFVGRRVLRIFPPYYLLIAILVGVNLSPARELLPWLATYTFNYVAATYKAAGHENPLYYLWSLSVEEQFYLIWPAIVILLRHNKPAMVVATATIVIVGYAQLTFDIVPQLSVFNYTGLFNRMGSLGMGALGAAYVSWKALPERFFRSLAVEIVVLCILAAALARLQAAAYVLLGLCSLYLVLKAVHFEFRLGPINRALAHPWIVYVGGISYGIYLFHVPVGHLFTHYIFDPVWLAIPFDAFGSLSILRWNSWIVKFPLYAAMSVTAAAVSYRWFESPILSLKDRWFRYR